MSYAPVSQQAPPPAPGPPPQQQWMEPPPAMPNVPPGLEYLTMVDQVLVHQVVELLQAFTGWETNNKYMIKNSVGQQIYYAFEKSDFCCRMFAKNQREFTMHIVNNFNQVRGVGSGSAAVLLGCRRCCACTARSSSVRARPAASAVASAVRLRSPLSHRPVGRWLSAKSSTVIGRVIQQQACCTLNFHVCDADYAPQLYIEGACIMCRCCSDVEFPVYSLDRTTKLGCITKQWTGMTREMFTQADNFGVSFPIDLDVKIKAVLLAATFLIDFMAFEQRQQ